MAQAFRLELDDGRAVFAKTHPSPPAGFFTTEATGLRWLAEPGVVAVPEVLAVSDGEGAVPPFLVLAWIEQGRPRPTTDDDFGRALAALHRATPERFGREDRRSTGSRGLPNEPCDTWAEFYATQRLAPLARLARDERCAAPERARRRSSASTRIGCERSVAPPSHPPASTATCGPATGSSTSSDRAG